jgi:sulfite reductase (NADPH) flavoprotein alpha-component
MGSDSSGEKRRSSYEVIVVGAGPAALLEKAAFPRDKYCGDAWCAPALDILEEMGVLQKLEADGLVRDTTSGGFISPSGESYVSVEQSEAVAGTRCYAIKRIICDERIARRAVDVGADLFENAAVAAAELETDGLWTVSCDDGRRLRSRMLVAADGATSRIARSLGVVTTAPEGVAGRQYVKGGTHNFKSGGVLFYPKYVLPGYVALFRHYDDDIDLGCYAIPGGAVSPDHLVDLYENQIRNDPFIQRALGPRVEFRERLRVASLRLGGVQRSTARQFMAVGDAAGQTDPLTGEGIHTGMIGGKLAAQTIHELFARGEFSAEACRLYHERWMAAFGRDFRASAAGARLVCRFPLLMDVANLTAQRKGDAFMAEFGAAMTGVKPKTVFLRPDLALPMGAEVVRQVVRRKLLRSCPAEEVAYAARAVEKTQRATAFRNSCLIDAGVEPSAPPPDPGAEEAGSRALEEVFRHAGHDPAARRVLVLYGSEYGFAKEMARRLCEALARVKVAGEGSALSPRCVSMADHEIVDWDETTTCLLVCSTTGDGVPPTHARGFFERLASSSLDLSGLRCATLALGDRTYPHFCRAGRRLDERLRERGAEPLVSRVDVDREDMAAIDGWIDAVCARLSEPATWEGVRADPRREGLAERARQHFARRSEQRERPTRAAPFLARVLVKRPLAELVEASDPETIGLELDVSEAADPNAGRIVWEPGDALGVIPTNCPDEVEAVLAALGRSGDEQVQLPGAGGRASLREALLRYLDIKNPAAPLLDALMDLAEAPGERERAKALREDRDRSYMVYREERELQDVLGDFSTAARALEPERLAGLLAAIAPRHYSIASSASVTPDRVGLAVAVVRYERLGRARSGLATTYLADRVEQGERIPVFVRSNPGFRLPPLGEPKPCVMIGAGTGAAPLRAFLQELVERARGEPGGGGEPHLLFLGFRHETRDFLYAREWRAWEAAGVVRLFTVFSRDQAEKLYVQDCLREQGALLWGRMESGNHFYVCGDATQMAGGVEHAMLEIVRTHGGKTPVEAQTYLAELESAGRLQKDVWPTGPSEPAPAREVAHRSR